MMVPSAVFAESSCKAKFNAQIPVPLVLNTEKSDKLSGNVYEAKIGSIEYTVIEHGHFVSATIIDVATPIPHPDAGATFAPGAPGQVYFNLSGNSYAINCYVSDTKK